MAWVRECLLRRLSIHHYLPLLVTVRHYISHYSRIFTVLGPFAIRYSGFPDTCDYGKMIVFKSTPVPLEGKLKIFLRYDVITSSPFAHNLHDTAVEFALIDCCFFHEICGGTTNRLLLFHFFNYNTRPGQRHWGRARRDCCAASVASKQHYKQDLRKIYRKGDEFSNWSLFTRMHCI